MTGMSVIRFSIGSKIIETMATYFMVTEYMIHEDHSWASSSSAISSLKGCCLKLYVVFFSKRSLCLQMHKSFAVGPHQKMSSDLWRGRSANSKRNQMRSYFKTSTAKWQDYQLLYWKVLLRYSDAVKENKSTCLIPALMYDKKYETFAILEAHVKDSNQITWQMNYSTRKNRFKLENIKVNMMTIFLFCVSVIIGTMYASQNITFVLLFSSVSLTTLCILVFLFMSSAEPVVNTFDDHHILEKAMQLYVNIHHDDSVTIKMRKD